jgi:hypothetical protein
MGFQSAKRHRPFTSPLTEFVRVELIQNLQKRLDKVLKKNPNVTKRDQLKATMSYCSELDSNVTLLLDGDDDSTKRYTGWAKLIRKFMDHIHGGHKMFVVTITLVNM